MASDLDAASTSAQPAGPRPLGGLPETRPDPRPIPESVARIVSEVPEARARRALTGESSLLLDKAGLAFFMLEARLGCLVADGDPITHWRPDDVVADFIGLAKAGGRVPIIRGATGRYLRLYESMGLTATETVGEPVVHLCGLWNDTRAIARIRKDAQSHGMSIDVLPEAWAASVLPELMHIESPLVNAALGSAPLAILRERGRPVAFSSLMLGAPGGEVEPGAVWREGGVNASAGIWLLAGIAEWARTQGYHRVSAEAFQRDLRDIEVTAPEGCHVPVRWEPRYDVRPRGLGGFWASVAARLTATA